MTSTATWILRVNPLRRERLADTAQSQLLARLVSLDRELHALAPRCSEELYQRIGMTEDAGEKKDLLAVRRAIHNGRVPGAVPEGLGPAATRWIELARTRAAVVAAAEAEFEPALRRERAALAQFLGDPDFQAAQALVAPEVHAAAVRYRESAGTGTALPQSVRKSERGLLQYLTRAMIRTSPLSRFTAVGLARLDPAGIRLDEARFTGATPFVSVDRVMFNYVAGGLTRQQAGDGTSIQQSPQLRLGPDGTKVIFSREVEGKVRVRALPLSPAVLLVIELTSMGPRRLAEVARGLGERLGESNEEAAARIQALLDAGMLCVAPGPEEIVADPVRDLCAKVAPEHRAALLDLDRRLGEFGGTPAAARPGALAGIAAAATRLSRAARRPAVMQVDEDYLMPPVAVSTRGYDAALRDLAAAVGVLTVFDPLHDFRALLTAAFVDRFGAGAAVPLTANAKALTAEVYRRSRLLAEETAAELGPADGSLAALHAARRRLSGLVLKECAGQPGPEVVIPPADLAAAIEDLPVRFRATPQSYGVLVQPWQGRLILNDALAGHGILFGRFLGADRELGGHAAERLARRVLARYGADGVRVAEDRGLHRLNVNARPPALDDRLAPDDWFGLRLWHDADADQLWVLDADGRRTRVLSFGTGHPELYPPPMRVANWLVSCARLLIPFGDDLYRAAVGDAGRTWSCPRLRVGSVIVSRRRWYGHDELASAVDTQGDAQRLVALARWRAANDVPDEVVFKTPSGPLVRRGGEGGGQRPTRSRRDKPQYIDLASALLTRVMPRLLERRNEGFLEEALPPMAGSPHAFEWVAEVSRPAFGDFGIEEA